MRPWANYIIVNLAFLRMAFSVRFPLLFFLRAATLEHRNLSRKNNWSWKNIIPRVTCMRACCCALGRTRRKRRETRQRSLQETSFPTGTFVSARACLVFASTLDAYLALLALGEVGRVTSVPTAISSVKQIPIMNAITSARSASICEAAAPGHHLPNKSANEHWHEREPELWSVLCPPSFCFSELFC